MAKGHQSLMVKVFLLLQGGYSDASAAAAAARDYYLQAKLASEAAERWAQGKQVLCIRAAYSQLQGCCLHEVCAAATHHIIDVLPQRDACKHLLKIQECRNRSVAV